MKLHISNTLSLPVDAATQTFAFIGRKGSGKTYGAGKLAELMIDHGIQTIVLDSVGNWYGLRISADGKGDGIDVPILGGLRGDIPLEATGGALIADAIVESGRSMVVDISQFSKADRQRFALALGERLWQRKKAEREPSPVHLVIEESQLIVPEMVKGDMAKMVGIYEEIIRLGRNYGIGVTMISQRPQSINKEVLNQTECLLVFQVNGAHERKALREWIVHQGMDVSLLNELPSLKPGNCYVWSPQWLEILQRIHIAPKRTFDSTQTPKSGAKIQRRDPKPIDLAALKEKMAATIERAKADDPRELRKRISVLEKQLRDFAPISTEPKIREVSVLTDADRKLINEKVEFLQSLTASIQSLAGALPQISERTESLLKALHAIVTPKPSRPFVRTGTSAFTNERVEFHSAPPPKANGKDRIGTGSSEIGKGGLRRILIALAQRPKGLSAGQLGVRAEMSSKSGTFGTYLSNLKSNGWIEGGRDQMTITDTGLAALGDYEPLPEGEELLNYWIRELGGGAARMLKSLADVYPKELSKEELAERSCMAVSGTFGTYLSTLRRLELVEGKSSIKASEELF